MKGSTFLFLEAVCVLGATILGVLWLVAVSGTHGLPVWVGPGAVLGLCAFAALAVLAGVSRPG